MAWNANPSIIPKIREFLKIYPHCRYLLGYNEPNLKSQARMTPREAADHWPELRSFATESGLQLISPAMNYGTLENYHDPIVWLDEFFSYVSLDSVDGIAIHCYMPSYTSMKEYVSKFKKYHKPIWLTEFCAWGRHGEISIEKQIGYMDRAMKYLDSDPEVFRYSWFIPRGKGPIDPETGSFSNNFFVDENQTLTQVGALYLGGQ